MFPHLEEVSVTAHHHQQSMQRTPCRHDCISTGKIYRIGFKVILIIFSTTVNILCGFWGPFVALSWLHLEHLPLHCPLVMLLEAQIQKSMIQLWGIKGALSSLRKSKRNINTADCTEYRSPGPRDQLDDINYLFDIASSFSKSYHYPQRILARTHPLDASKAQPVWCPGQVEVSWVPGAQLYLSTQPTSYNPNVGGTDLFKSHKGLHKWRKMTTREKEGEWTKGWNRKLKDTEVFSPVYERFNSSLF